MRQTLVVLGIGVLVAGLAPTAQAQSTSSSSSDSGSVTLSGDSLQTVESRTVSGDFLNFFNGTSPTGQDNSVTNVGRLRARPQTSPLSNVVGDNVDVIFGDTLNPEAPLTSFPSSGDAGDNDRVRVQLQLGE